MGTELSVKAGAPGNESDLIGQGIRGTLAETTIQNRGQVSSNRLVVFQYCLEALSTARSAIQPVNHFRTQFD